MSGKDKDRKETPGEIARSLFARGDFKRAAYALLPSANRHEAAPADLRLLAECYLRLDSPAEALNWIDALPTKTSADLDLAGRCLLTQRRWKEADARFVAALKAGGDAAPALGRADALLQGRALATLGAVDRNRYAELLITATRLPNCARRAFETLADLAAGDPARVVVILRAEVTAHPDLVAPRVRLARVLLDHLNDAAGAHEVIRPVSLDDSAPADPEALWLAFQASQRAGEIRSGLAYVERLRPFFAPIGIGPDKLLGDIYLRLGERGYAIMRYEAEIRRGDSAARFVGLFGRTAALLDVATPDEILATARLALGAWFATWSDGVDFDWLHPGGGAVVLRPNIPTLPAGEVADGGVVSLSYPFADDIERVARRLAVPGYLPEPEIAARASGLLYSFHGQPSTTEGREWLLAAATLDHPRLGADLARLYLTDGDLDAALGHLLDYAAWLSVRPKSQESIDRAIADVAVGAREQIAPLDLADRLTIHRSLVARLDARRDPDVTRRVFLPVYRAIWRDLLSVSGLEDDLLQLISRLLADAPEDHGLLLDRAETLVRCGLLESAERVFRDLLARDQALAVAHEGLAAILEKRQALREAVKHSAEAIRLAPSPELITRHEGLRAKLEENERVGPDHPDLLKSAPYRWRLLSPPERTLLGVINAISGFRDWDHLARLAGLPVDAIPRQWQRLVDLGMITWSASGRAFEINEHIRTLLIADHPAPALGRVIAGGTESAVKCIFNSPLEADTYRALVEVFPNHLVLPDVALAAVFDFQQMQALLAPADFAYFRQARVDFSVVATTNYVPFLGIETDSHYHDKSVGVERDRTKDAIFQLGGLPLLRFRPVGDRDAAAIRDQLQEMVRGLRDELRGQIARSGYRNSRSSLRHLAPEE